MYRTAINFIIGFFIGRTARQVYDYQRTKKETSEFEKQKIYREVYGEEAYKEKYVYPYQEEPVTYTEEDYLELEYRDIKKNPIITFLLTFMFGSVGYLYITTIGFAIVLILNVFLYVSGVLLVDNLFGSGNPTAMNFLIIGVVIVRITHTIIATYVTIRINNKLRKNLGL